MAAGEVLSPTAGVVRRLDLAPGAGVREGESVGLIEVMKMEVEVRSPAAGTVRSVEVREGDEVVEGEVLARLDAGPAESPQERAGPLSGAAQREELAELAERKRLTRDEARPQAVARRRAAGGRTARENLTDLVDPGSFVEYGALALAAQRARRSEEELVARTPADGLIGGIGRVNGSQFAERSRCAVVSYDYTVLAGTQGATGHMKKDRLFELVRRLRIPVVLFAEGGGGRPGDTDYATGSALTARAFALWGRLSGRVPRIAVVAGNCFAGNAALAGASDLIIATERASIGMGGPAMVAGGGLGRPEPEEIGPIGMQEANGVVDLRVADEREAVAAARRLVSYFQGALPAPDPAEQDALREIVPESRRRAYPMRQVISTLLDPRSVCELRRGFGAGMITALARLGGRPLGVLANDPEHLAGAITSAGADKAARFMQLCEAHGLPLLSLVDTPGMMVGPEAEQEALVRHSSRLFAIGPNLTVPHLAVVVGRAYGLGAQAMVGGSFLEPLLTLAWPTGELGPMGIEGAVELGMRSELEAIEEPAERERRFRDLVAGLRHHFRALNVATYYEIDDVVDPAETRELLAGALEAAPSRAPAERRELPWLDTW